MPDFYKTMNILLTGNLNLNNPVLGDRTDKTNCKQQCDITELSPEWQDFIISIIDLKKKNLLHDTVQNS